MSSPRICSATATVISSPGSAAGPLQLDLWGGPPTANSGPARAPASRSPKPALVAVTTTLGTYGPTSYACSVPAGPLSGWESKLRTRLATAGSTECSLTWKLSATPAGRPLCRLVPSTRHTVVTASGSSANAALWITASARDWKDTPGMGLERPDGRRRIDQLPRQVATALWSTPTSLAPARNGNNEAGNSAGLVAIRGHAIAGLSGTTEERGALNPMFVCWLMGFPPEWDACAPTAMPSCRRSRRK